MAIIAWPVAIGVMSLLSWTAVHRLGTHTFLPGSCERMESYLSEHLVGQDLAVSQLVAAVCSHLDQPEPQKPLILSIHGPPGVGKSFTHLLMAKALYNRHPERVSNCPGVGCAGYKVIYGLDFPQADRLEQLAAVKESILSHVKNVRDPLLVFEEYDKLDCTARTWLRHMLAHATDSGAMSRAVVLLESNLGYTELEEMLSNAKGEVGKLTPEAAERTLRDALFVSWRTPRTQVAPASTAAATADQTEHTGPVQCEETYVDTMRFTALVDFFLPYLPLQRQHVETLVSKALHRERTRVQDRKNTLLEWDEQAVAWLASKVEFDGFYPLEGAKQVASVITRYVSPQIRKCPDASHAKKPAPPFKLQFPT